MGLEEVELDIKKRIESKINTIRNAAEKESSAIIGEAKAKINKLKKMRDKEVEKIIAEMKNREIAAANLQARKLKMATKKEMMEKVFNHVKERLLNMSITEKKEILSALIERAKKELPDAKYVFCRKEDKDLVNKLILKSGLQLDGSIECAGGIIIENSDRAIRVDYTYDGLLERFRKNSLKEVAGHLFSI